MQPRWFSLDCRRIFSIQNDFTKQQRKYKGTKRLSTDDRGSETPPSLIDTPASRPSPTLLTHQSTGVWSQLSGSQLSGSQLTGSQLSGSQLSGESVVRESVVRSQLSGNRSPYGSTSC